eukprot:993504-Heterocapsa_arctica.AAC.1
MRPGSAAVECGAGLLLSPGMWLLGFPVWGPWGPTLSRPAALRILPMRRSVSGPAVAQMCPESWQMKMA